MPLIIASVDKTLVIPPKMRGKFPNEKELTIELKAEEPTEVPEYVAEYYTKNRPNIYRLAGEPKKEETKTNNKTSGKEFDPIEWLNLNHASAETALPQLERKEILSIGRALGLSKNISTQKTERVIERIVQDIKVKDSQQKELNEHKGTA